MSFFQIKNHWKSSIPSVSVILSYNDFTVKVQVAVNDHLRVSGKEFRVGGLVPVIVIRHAN